MKKITLHFKQKSREYPILIGSDLIGKISKLFSLKKYSSSFVITDENTAKHFLDKLLQNLPENTKHIVLPSGEKTKTLDSVQKILKAMLEAKCDRKSLVINLGGGVIGDMGGFAASIYMRGVDFMQIPTTLLSQIDASVGGKTAIDFAGVKNLIGTFEQPIGVVIDVTTLTTLPKREMVSGFAEMIKHGLILDKEYLAEITSKSPMEFSAKELEKLIARSCEIKKQIVESDETEIGTRKLLNFGHTIGHAIEAISLETGNPLLHGEAISIGMIAEAKISEKMGLLARNEVEKLEESLKNAGLPTRIKQIDINEIKKKMLADKKNVGGKIGFVLLKAIGQAILNQDVLEEIINEAIEYVIE